MLFALVLSALASVTRPFGGEGEAKFTPVVGGASDFARVAHVSIAGSSFTIGRELARLGHERHGCEVVASKDAARTRAQRESFAAKSPAQLERMRGVADYFGVALDDAHELASLAYSGVSAGCTVVFYPPEQTDDGRGVLARNFDFTTGTFDGRKGTPDDPPACSAPYVLELHPTDAYASLALVAFDLLGVVDGINSEGLTVALLADDELFATDQAHPSPGVAAGFDVLQVGRFLLDTCKDVAEARAALEGAHLYYTSIPCHYLVADREGRAFIWENAVDLSGGHVIETASGPLVTTNYLQHLHPDAVPADRNPLGLFGRQKTLCSRFPAQGKFSLDEIRANAASVSARGPADASFAPGRTLWHAFYFPTELRLEVDFYLGEGATEPRRSSSFVFDLAR